MIYRYCSENSKVVLMCCLFSFLLFSCSPHISPSFEMKHAGSDTSTAVNIRAQVRLFSIDKNATPETNALFNNLKKISKNNTLFGHHDDTKTGYGRANVYNPDNYAAPYIDCSDVKSITGVYPAVFGWDFMRIVDFYTGNRKAWETKITRGLTIDAYNKGAVNTYSWHYQNPVAGEGIWWRDAKVEAVRPILPGGSHHDVYKKSLRELAEYAKSLIGADGKLIPIIFRPFHEMNGDWFWWGKGHCTVQEYKSLYRFTVEYLRDSMSIHNFLYAWSPDREFTTKTQYLKYYPGDAYTDIVGVDDYYDLLPGTDPNIAAYKLKIISDYAIKKNKVAAFTETGLDKISQPDWFTKMLNPALHNKPLNISYVMLWSNTNDMYFIPYAGHPAEKDFIQFKSDPHILFTGMLPNFYTF